MGEGWVRSGYTLGGGGCVDGLWAAGRRRSGPAVLGGWSYVALEPFKATPGRGGV